MWPRWTHTLVPLTGLTFIKTKLKWAQVKQDNFDGIIRIIARDTLLKYLDFN